MNKSHPHSCAVAEWCASQAGPGTNKVEGSRLEARDRHMKERGRAAGLGTSRVEHAAVPCRRRIHVHHTEPLWPPVFRPSLPPLLPSSLIRACGRRSAIIIIIIIIINSSSSSILDISSSQSGGKVAGSAAKCREAGKAGVAERRQVIAGLPPRRPKRRGHVPACASSCPHLVYALFCSDSGSGGSACTRLLVSPRPCLFCFPLLPLGT
ncbi:unnamed protein product, partial [Protopolystoma xenopodis]